MIVCQINFKQNSRRRLHENITSFRRQPGARVPLARVETSKVENDANSKPLVPGLILEIYIP